MLGQHRRRLPNIKATLGQHNMVFAAIHAYKGFALCLKTKYLIIIRNHDITSFVLRSPVQSLELYLVN